ncbi:hypothetical protein Poly21_26790 [Allorhodopirellula heiligendammensis]|uniref:Uncharacterized protein n=1 Tax=Allorhodopirellula heiligendammensis TaxID=2714739 RepID=A0A5C6BTE5_9BACT|nr:hypothetical protein Poly21_26790 [Allorhodopirellula heiligendammensis]
MGSADSILRTFLVISAGHGQDKNMPAELHSRSPKRRSRVPKAQRSSLRADRELRVGQEPRQRSAEVTGGILSGLRTDEPRGDLNNV